MTPTVLAAILPAVFSLFVQLITFGVRPWAAWATKNVRIEGRGYAAENDTYAVDLAVYVYTQFTAFFQALTAIVTVYASTLITNDVWPIALSVVAILCVLGIWFMHGLRLTGQELDGPKGKNLNLLLLIPTLLVLGGSIYAVFHPKIEPPTNSTPTYKQDSQLPPTN